MGISFLVILAIVNGLGLVASAGVGVAEKVCAFIMLVPAAFMQAMSAFVAQNRGAGKLHRAVQGLNCAVAVSVVFGVAMFVLNFFRGDILSYVFASDERVIAASADYLRAYAIDCLLTCFLFCFIGFFNGMEYTRFVMVQGIVGAFCRVYNIRGALEKYLPNAYADTEHEDRLTYTGGTTVAAHADVDAIVLLLDAEMMALAITEICG